MSCSTQKPRLIETSRVKRLSRPWKCDSSTSRRDYSSDSKTEPPLHPSYGRCRLAGAPHRRPPSRLPAPAPISPLCITGGALLHGMSAGPSRTALLAVEETMGKSGLPVRGVLDELKRNASNLPGCSQRDQLNDNRVSCK